MAPVAAVVSFRLGGEDGVSVEARKWSWALRELGFHVRRVAGEIAGPREPGDVVLPSLRIDAADEVDPAVLERALEPADLTVVENLLSLPLNLAASLALEGLLRARDGRVLLHHHDLPWQRARFRHVDALPARLPGALHVTINERSRRELEARGIEASTIRNHFDLDAPLGDRDTTRTALGLDERQVLVLHPTRAIPRKNVPRAVSFCDALARHLPGRDVVYWLPGGVEEAYGPVVDAAVSAARVRVLRCRGVAMPDAYAACDAIVYSSSWEGFGNPVVESVWARRPLAVARYPVLAELLELGLTFYEIDEPRRLAAVIAGDEDPTGLLDANLTVARRHLAIELLPGRLDDLLGRMRWTTW